MMGRGHMSCDDVRHEVVGDEYVVRNAKNWGVSGSVAVSDGFPLRDLLASLDVDLHGLFPTS